jgi:hypothetical protein
MMLSVSKLSLTEDDDGESIHDEKRTPRSTKKKRARVPLPSLSDNFHPGWAVHKHPHIATMTEVGTGRSYDIPNSRFNKAAIYLSWKHVNGGLQRKLNANQPDPANQPVADNQHEPGQSVCRCLRRCASGTDPDWILTCREWFYKWHTHDEAVSELARVLAKNNREHGKFYIIRGKQVDCNPLVG